MCLPVATARGELEIYRPAWNSMPQDLNRRIKPFKRHFDNCFRIHCSEDVGFFVNVLCHFLIKLFFWLCLTMILSWCCVTKIIEMSLLFLLFIGAIPLLWILSPIDVTLYFYGLGIFDCISRAYWSKSMRGHHTVDVLQRWIIELTIWAPRSQASNEEKLRREISHLQYVFISRQVRGNRLLIHRELYQRTLKQNVLKQRPSSLPSKNICVDCLAIVRLVN